MQIPLTNGKYFFKVGEQFTDFFFIFRKKIDFPLGKSIFPLHKRMAGNYRDRAHPRAFSGCPGSLCDLVDRFFWFLVVHIHHTHGSLGPHAKILPFALWRTKNISRRLGKSTKFQNTIGFIRKSFQIHSRTENLKILKS